MKPLQWILLILLLSLNLFSSSDVILRLDTKGHTGVIQDVIITKNKDIITASDDKTIRVWDSKTGKEKRKILGQVGSGSEGKIYAIALSSNEKYLAVGGYLNYNRNHEYGNIRIYNYQTTKLIKVLKSHTSIVNDLSFSSDDKYLISGSADKTAKIWDVKNKFRLRDTIKFHTNFISTVKIIKTHSKYFAITAGDDNKVALYDIQTKKIINSDTSKYQLLYLAVNDNHIAVCGEGKEILVYDYDLKYIKTIKSETYGLLYSKDGKFLIAGTGASPYNVSIYKANKNYKLKTSFKKHTNLTMAVGFLDNNTAISAGGDNKEIYIWNINTAKVKKKIVGVGNRVWSVGLDGDSVAWGNKFDAQGDYHIKQSSLQKSININTHKISTVKNRAKSFKRINTKNTSYVLSHSKGGEYDYGDAVLNIKYKNKLKAKIIRSTNDGLGHRCYGWYKDYIVSGGSNGYLTIYNKSGKLVASLVGHTGSVWSIAIDGDRLVSGSADQTIKVWDLSKVRESEIIYPMLNIFVSKDNEWVMWTKEGFFNASKNGAQYIGYHINQGVDKEARYVSVDKLYDTFYRPDLIQKAITGEDISKYAQGIDIEAILGAGLAPTVSIKTELLNSDKRDLNLELEVCTIDDGGYDNLTLLLNDTAVDVMSKDRALKRKKVSKTREDCFTFEKLISLNNGENIIGFKATNKVGNIDSNTDSIKVNYKGRSSNKPNLYILAIGVDKYRDGDLWLKYSKADAKVFVETISSVSKPLFKTISATTLLDKEVTKENILKTFEEIGAKTTREDVFMLYIAGHGITDVKTGSYFYLPVDFRYKNDDSVREKGLSQNDFKLGLSKIQAMKSLTILDTCNSGSFAEAMASRGVLQKTAINKLTRATGRATIVASSKDQVALEGYKGHGVFTYTLVEALNGKGYGSNNQITIKELAAYIEDTLPDRTYDKWGYEQVPQSHITGNDFPIGMK